VGIGLVTDVPDKFVVGGVEDVVEGEGEFDSTKGRGEMAGVECEGMDDVVTQFETELFEVGDGECPEVVDGVDAAEDDAGEFVGALELGYYRVVVFHWGVALGCEGWFPNDA
jgi:hypothetical protein